MTVTDAYEGFRGRVGKTIGESQPWWPPRARAGADAPNIVIIICDDMGYSDIGCYGSEILTPHLDALAAGGLRYTNFHSNTVCSPSRAALMTGINAHATGVGWVMTNCDPGFPGYAGELRPDVVTLPEALRAAGYATLMVGKWHLSKEFDLSDAGSRASWPIARGFDKYYGVLGGLSAFHAPSVLWSDNQVVDVDQYPDGYYLTDDLTDRAIRMIRESKAGDPQRPFFLYFSHLAVHAPLQARTEDMRRYRGRYEAGWDAIRAERFQRQLDKGLVPAGTVLPPRNSGPSQVVRPWAGLSRSERELFARHMEVYAAMIDNVDQSVGRVVRCLEELGEAENTLIIFTSDNGASREGEEIGTTQYFNSLSYMFRKFADDPSKALTSSNALDLDHSRLDLIGGPRTLCHYPRGWAMASNTPFRLYKRNTHAGGHQVPFVLSWPKRVQGDAGLRRQYLHFVDVLPTLLELCEVEKPATRNGLNLLPLDGRSFARTIEDASADPVRTEQYYIGTPGHRGFYRDGWEIVTAHRIGSSYTDAEWELYDLHNDPTETTDLAARLPDKVSEMARAWEAEAWRNCVFPFDVHAGQFQNQRPEWEHDLAARAVRIVPGTPTLDRYRSQLLIGNRSFTVSVDLDFEPGHQGTLVAHGDQSGGYGLYVDADGIVYVHNAYGVVELVRGGPVAAGPHTIDLVVEAPGDWVWNVTLKVDGETVAERPGLVMHAMMSPFQGIDVGVDSKSPVWWDVYECHGPFRYSGRLRSATFTPGPFAPDAPALKLEQMRQAADRYE